MLLINVKSYLPIVSINVSQEKLQNCTKCTLCSGFGASFDAEHSVLLCFWIFILFFFPLLFLSLAYSAKDMFIQPLSFQKNKQLEGVSRVSMCLTQVSMGESGIIIQSKANKANNKILTDCLHHHLSVLEETFWNW